jgi:hypothetical protein
MIAAFMSYETEKLAGARKIWLRDRADWRDLQGFGAS